MSKFKMKLITLILLLILNSLFLCNCSIVGLTTGIIIDLKSYEETTINKDTLKTLTSKDQLIIRLKNGETHYGKFNRLETLNDSEAYTSKSVYSEDSTSTLYRDSGWNIVIEEKIGVSSFHNGEITQIKVHKRGYAPLRGFVLGFIIDFIIIYFLINNFELGTGG